MNIYTRPRIMQIVVKKFRVDSLSAEVKARFKELFHQSPKWSKEDLVPYLDDLVGPSVCEGVVVCELAGGWVDEGSASERVCKERECVVCLCACV